MQKFEKMPYNDVVVAELEMLLGIAKQGKINWFGYSMCEGPLHGYNNFVGEMGSYYAGHYGLIHCADRVKERLNQSPGPVPTRDAPANMWAYEVSAEPVAFDFIAWLVTVKMIQAQAGVEGPTKICFIRNKQADNFVDPAYRAKFYETVMYPALRLFDCVQDKEAKEGRRNNVYTYKEMVGWSKRGQPVPRIAPPPDIMAGMRANLDGIEPVVITLREHHHWTHRNSALTDWLKFAEYLHKRGEHVIFVRDYAKADEDIAGFDTMPVASRDLLVRAALYEHAKCNFFVSNGPATLGLFGSRPWIQFIECRDDEIYLQNTPQWWFLNHGIVPGEQFPWCAPNQRIVWKPDTLDAMIEAWEDVFPQMLTEAAE